jgi:hypothetical protein
MGAGAQSRGAGPSDGVPDSATTLAALELWKMGRALSRGGDDGERRFGGPLAADHGAARA